MAKLCQRLIRDEPELDNHLKPKHLDPSALDTPALALAMPRARRCALVTRWSRCWRACKVMHGEPRQEKNSAVWRMISTYFTAIKLYLARMPRDELADEESGAGRKLLRCR